MIEVVKASAGTGKSYMLVQKVKQLIDKGVQPGKILAITFSRNAKDELKGRIDNGEVRVETIHALFNSLLSRLDAGKYRFGKIIQDHAQDIIIYRLIAEHKLYKVIDKNGLTAKDIKSFIGLSKNLYIKPLNKFRKFFFNTKNTTKLNNKEKNEIYNHYKQVVQLSGIGAEDNGLPNYFALAILDTFYKEYETSKKGIDYDDLLIDMYEAFLVDKGEILSYAQDKWNYILVDEFQDTNLLQFNSIKMMAEKHKNLFMIGDWKQSIYEWRGGDYKLLKNIKAHYPEAKETTLSKTYRNSKEVLKIANHVATQMLKDEPIETNSNLTGKVVFNEYVSRKEEAESIVSYLKQVNDDQQTFFIMARTNAQLLPLEMLLLLNKIPYSISKESMLNSETVLDLSMLLQLCRMPGQYPPNVLKRLFKFACKMLPRIDKDALLKEGHNAKLSTFGQKQWDELVEKINNLSKVYHQKQCEENFLSSMMNEFIEAFDYFKYVDETFSVEDKSKMRDALVAFIEIVDVFETTENLLLSIFQAREPNPDAKIKLMTIHASKGLEANTVFLIGLTQKIFPSQRASLYEETIDAEKRLLYVAVTRAEENLIVSYHGKQSTFYEFLKEY